MSSKWTLLLSSYWAMMFPNIHTHLSYEYMKWLQSPTVTRLPLTVCLSYARHSASSLYISISISSITQSCLTLQPHELQHARPPCPSPTPGVHPNPCPSSRWCHPTISSSVVPFSSCPQSFPASGSFQMSQLFALGVVSASTSILPMNTQDWSLSGWTGWILQSKGLSRVFSNTTYISYIRVNNFLHKGIRPTWLR